MLLIGNCVHLAVDTVIHKPVKVSCFVLSVTKPGNKHHLEGAMEYDCNLFREVRPGSISLLKFCYLKVSYFIVGQVFEVLKWNYK